MIKPPILAQGFSGVHHHSITHCVIIFKRAVIVTFFVVVAARAICVIAYKVNQLFQAALIG